MDQARPSLGDIGGQKWTVEGHKLKEETSAVGNMSATALIPLIRRPRNLL